MSVIDFAEYKLVMRAGPGLAAARSYYLVGLTNGLRQDAAVARARRLAEAIRAERPDAVVYDPAESWPAAADHELVSEFHRLAGLAAESDVCVAWVPDRDSLAAAAAELQTACRAGRTVVVITGVPGEFLVRAFASVVLPDLDAFAEWLEYEEGGYRPPIVG